MLLEIDEAAVDPTWTREQMIAALDGKTLYLHAFGGPEHAGWNVVTLREL